MNKLALFLLTATLLISGCASQQCCTPNGYGYYYRPASYTVPVYATPAPTYSVPVAVTPARYCY